MSSGGDIAHTTLICDPEGIVQFLAMPRAQDDDWASGEQVAPHVGKPLIKTYWFDHLDCDHRELQQILRKAGQGQADRARVWMRIDEHQLIRAELTATPLTDASGQICSVLVRTEPSHLARRRNLGEPETRPVRKAETPSHDPLDIRLPIPLIRLDLQAGTILGANHAVATLLERDLQALVGLPLSECVDENDRRTLIEALSATDAASESLRNAEVTLLGAQGRQVRARLSLTPDPASPEGVAFVVVRDVSAEAMTQQLLRRADELTSVWVRNSERLALLERFFDRSPLPWAILGREGVIRSNAAFDEQTTPEQRLQLTQPANGSALSDLLHYAVGDTPDEPSAVVLNTAASARPSSSSFTSLLTALRASGSHASVRVHVTRTIEALDDSLDALFSESRPESLDQLLSADSLSDVASALQVVQAGQTPDPLTARLIDGRPAQLSFAAFDEQSTVMLIRDDSRPKSEIERLTALHQEQAAIIDDLRARASAIDPDALTTALAQAARIESQWSSVLAALRAGTFTWTLDTGAIQADARAVELLGCAESPTAATLLASATLDERRQFEQAFADSISEGTPLDLIAHVGAERRPVRIVGQVVAEGADDAREPQYLTAVVIDLSEATASTRRLSELESQLALRQAELNAILESSSDSIRLLTDGTLRHNEAAGELFGESVAEAFADDASIRSADKDVSNSEETPASLARRGERVSKRMRLHRNGEERILLSTAVPVTIDGALRGVVAIDSDQTDVGQLETRLALRDAEVSALFGNTGIGVAFLDSNRNITNANPTLCALLGLAPVDLLGRPLASLAADDDRALLVGQFEAVSSNELRSCTSELRLIRRDESARWVQLTVTAAGTGSNAFSILAQDVNELHDLRTRRDALTRELENVQHEQQTMAASVQTPRLHLDGQGNLLHANDAALALFDLQNRTALTHLTFIAPESGNIVRDPFAPRHAQRKPSIIELRVRRSDDELFVGRFSIQPQANGGVLLDVTDVTRVHALQEELQKANARIVESHTLLQNRTKQLEGNFVSAVQQLGASIASSYALAKAVRNDARLPKPLLPLAREVVDSFRVHRRLVQYYTSSTLSSTTQPAEPLDVHDLVRDAIRTLSERFNISGRLTTALEASRSVCKLDGALIRHALWSLLAHAASQSNRTPAQVRSTSLTTTDEVGRLHVEIAWPGTRVDTAEVTLARSLVESCGGGFEIRTASNWSVAAIEFGLFLADNAPAELRESLRLLLVEDHESTARVLRRQLEKLRCHVTHVQTVAAAVAAIEQSADLDLIVSDLTLNDGDAALVIGDLSRRRDVPAIAMRSYGGVEDPDELRAAGFEDHIDKPVDLTALTAAIERITANR